MKSPRSPLVALASLFVSLLVPATGRADGPQTGILEGRVTDPQGQPLPGVTVTLAGPQTDRTLTTGESGSYRFALLVAGRYRVSAELEAMGSSEKVIDLESGMREEVDLTLSTRTSEAITVISEAPLVSRYQIGAAASLESEVAENLAFRSRLYASTVRMLPGVINPGDADGLPAMNGGTTSEVAAFVEGVDTSVTRRGGELRLAIPTSAVSDTRIQSAGFGAEYGRAVSAVLDTTIKTGSNRFHGEGLYVGQNTKWRAAYEELDIPRPDQAIHSYEASLGGPLRRDRAWFFAAAASISSNELTPVATGDVLNTSRDDDPRILKLNVQPGMRHQVTATGIDSPSDSISGPANAGDVYAFFGTPIDRSLYTGTWSFSVTDDTLLEVKASSHRERVGRVDLADHAVAPGASPDSPLGNNYRYIDFDDALRYNAPTAPLGDGFNEFPRDQGNVSLTRFLGRHELKAGADYQDVGFDNLTSIGQEYRGRGYDRGLPGGYTVPLNKRIYSPSGVVPSSGETAALFAQDRIDVGSRWTLTIGLRVDDQVVENDVGEEVVSYTAPAPRAAMSYDVNGDGRLLVRATAGRYYRAVALDIATREFARLSSGANEYDQFGWNAATSRYDRFQQHISPILDAVIPEFDPMYKDELSAGVDWAFDDHWILGGRLVWHQMGDLFWSTEQFDASGQVVTDVRNWDAGWRRYRGLVLELNRTFRDGWALRSNYTLGKAAGNADFNVDADGLFEALGGVEEGTGRTDATVVNRVGRQSFDREHVLNLVGLKRFDLGEHDLSLGAYYFFRSGERWGLGRATTIVHPVSRQTIATTTFDQPRDAQQLEDTFNLNLVLEWSFPISGSVRGELGAEVANLTDEQEVIGINLFDGRPVPTTAAFQSPREIRIKAGVSF